MIPYKVFPMFRVGPIRFNLYGIMFALGALVAMYLAAKEAAKKGIAKDIVYDLSFRALVGAIIGARLFYVMFYWPEGVPLTFFDVFKIWEGGIAFIGGFIGGVIAGLIFVRKRRLDFSVVADVFTLPLIVGHIFGRIGDYLTGGHPGIPTTLPWAIYLDGALRHPVILYEIVGLTIIGLTSLLLKRTGSFDGMRFLIYIQMYAIQRIFLDFFRLEYTDPRILGLTATQHTVIISFITATVILLLKFKRSGRNNSRNGPGLDLSEANAGDTPDSRYEYDATGRS